MSGTGEVQQKFAKAWGHKCAPFRQACYDQGSFVVFGSAHNPQQGGKAPLKALRLGNNHLDFRDFGDVIGIMQYPEMIFRPGNSHEEAPDLQQPISFSNCARPVVLYLNHLFMFGDFWVRTMPTLLNALHSPEGAWDTDYTIVVATGGQRLQAWQKLLLQPFSKHPIMTLSAASSRSIAYLTADELAHSYTYQTQHGNQHGTSRSGLGRRLANSSESHTTTRLTPSSVSTAGAEWSSRQRRRNLQQQQQQHTLTAQPPVTVYGRCFESLTVCSLQDPRGFPSSGARPIWSSAQFVRQFWEQQYGAQYKKLQQQYQSMRQAGALRVVIAVRADPTVRSILNVQELLDWCNAWKPQMPDKQPSAKYTRTVCIAHEFGRHGGLDAQPAGKPAAAAAAAESSSAASSAGTAATSSSSAAAAGSIDASSSAGTAAAATQPATTMSSEQQGSDSSSGSDSSAGKPKALSRVQEQLLELSGRVLGFLTGHSGTRNLLSTTAANNVTPPSAAAAAATAAAAADVSAAGNSRQNPAQHHQPDGHYSATTLRQQQQQQQQQQRRLAAAAGLPHDPELDPRGLLSDVALLDETDVVVGLHGAQLFNALYMPAHKALVEVRPFEFTGGWPDTYFKGPLAGEEQHADNSDGIFWFGIDTVKPSNSKPGKWEVEGGGCCHARDRHTRIEPAALEVMLRRIVWAAEDPQKYKQLASKGDTHITDTLQPAEEYHKQHGTVQPSQQQQQELKDRVAATKAEAKQQQQQQQQQQQPSPSPVPPPPPAQQQQQQAGEQEKTQDVKQEVKSDPAAPEASPGPYDADELAVQEQEHVEQQDEQELQAAEALQQQ
uniref:Uncharacterized protein n=1 Tax=Tetradesmus obliquus TaxID=3088 RepID=A0A383VT21_TETOB|eukprot:jgi/Sobl393_1/12484/SZX68655.1